MSEGAIVGADPASPGPAPEHRPFTGPGWLAATLLAVAAVVVFRRPETFLHPRLNIEDGAIFFKDALEIGPAGILRPYADYAHLVPRLAACGASLLPVSAAPALYAWTSLAILLGMCAFLFRRRLALPCPPLLALVVAMAPNAAALFGNLAHVQWFLALLFPLLAVQGPPGGRAGALADLVLLALAGLTGPFSLFALPLFAVRWALDREAHSLRMLVVVSGCAAAQAACMLQRQGAYIYMGDGPAYWARVLGMRLGGELLLGQRLASAAPTPLLVALTAGLLFGLWALVRDRPERRRLAAALGAFSLGVLLAMYAKSVVRVMVPHQWGSGERYFLVPHVAALWVAVACLEDPFPRRAAAAAFLVLVLALSTTANGFRCLEGPPVPWDGLARRIEAGERVHVPVPFPWDFDVQRRSR